MPFVHDASAELFRSLIRDKDKGFVIEFRDQPRYHPGADERLRTLFSARARDVRRAGATALYDAIVLGLYQFRTLQGRKALIVITDGDDNRSHVEYRTLLRYARVGGAPIYFIAVNIPMTDFSRKRITKAIVERSRAAKSFQSAAPPRSARSPSASRRSSARSTSLRSGPIP